MAFVFFLALTTSMMAETIVFRTTLSPANEVPPVAGSTATGTAAITLDINRDATGNIGSGSVDFDVDFQFPGSVTITGLHIYNGAAGVTGPARISSGISSINDADGAGNIFRRAEVGPSDPSRLLVLAGILSNPELYYVNLHTTVSPGGAIRGQLAAETLVFRTALSAANEVPPVTGLAATGAATVTLHLNRDSSGTVRSGSVDFEAAYGFPASVNFVGLDIHNAPAGSNGGIVISSGIGSSNSVTDGDGTGNIFRRVDIPSTDVIGVAALNAILVDPGAHYVNLRTADHPGGAMRGQLANDTVVFRVPMTPGNEVPAITGLDASGLATIAYRLNRDGAGGIISGTVTFDVDYRFPGSVTITGLHIHDGPDGVNAPVRISSGVSRFTDDDGSGNILRQAEVTSANRTALNALRGSLGSPERYYVNLHTTVFPGGAMRGQLRSGETVVLRTALSPANEVPPILGLDATGTALITLRLNRDTSGNLTSGIVDFDVDYRFPGAKTLTGLHIHNGAAGVNGPIRISSGLASTADSDGVGNISRRIEIPSGDAAGLATLQDMLDNPDLYYVNLQTATSPEGAIRAQLETLRSVYVQVARGGGFTSAFTVVNPSATNSLSGTVHFLGDDGKPRSLSETSLRFTLPPGGSRTVGTTPAGSLIGAYARITATDTVNSTLKFSLPEFGSATLGASETFSEFRGAVARNLAAGRTTGIALVNLGETAVRIGLNLLDSNGNPVPNGLRALDLKPKEHTARLLEELFPGASTGDFQGTVSVVSRFGLFRVRAVAGVILQLGPGQFSAVPLTPVP
ncbi:MAG: CHRD domain-containing protein [Acidobacteria bacterium]|nr:CHRD domain-containing protein [Acidobacteriota bacterium]